MGAVKRRQMRPDAVNGDTSKAVDQRRRELAAVSPELRAQFGDEEAAGSNPATPTQVRGRFRIMGDGLPCARAPLVRQDARTPL
jgi:hypothetical protein